MNPKKHNPSLVQEHMQYKSGNAVLCEGEDCMIRKMNQIK
jgi:hypothetical protein